MTHDELRALLKEHGINVKKAASMAHVSTGGMYRWLNGTRKIPPLAAEVLRERLSQTNGKVLRLGDTWGVR